LTLMIMRYCTVGCRINGRNKQNIQQILFYNSMRAFVLFIIMSLHSPLMFAFQISSSLKKVSLSYTARMCLRPSCCRSWQHSTLQYSSLRALSSLKQTRYSTIRLLSMSNSNEIDLDLPQKINYTSMKTESFFNDAERDANFIHYPKGIPEGFFIIKHYSLPPVGFDNLVTNIDGTEGYGVTQEEVDRLDIDNGNVTLPIALMLLDSEVYPSLSRARKSCRKGYIIIHRGPISVNKDTGEPEFDADKCIRGRVGDRVYPGDVIGIQVRMHGGYYPGMNAEKPSFDLPVVYEDDHFAIVNKPAGVAVYSQRKESHGMLSVRAALPFALRPPKRGTLSIIRRPVSVHRLDKPTSGLLLVAKTKPAMVHLSMQFVKRKVKKTYTAILNGIPSEPVETCISSREAIEFGVDIHPNDQNKWQLIDESLDEKSASTVWRPLKYVKSLKARDGILTLVEMKPKTGRYHQLRRHMAWVKNCPIVGDTVYDGGGDAMSLRGRGLFLCSNNVSLEHPHYNSPEGRKEWEALPETEKWGHGAISLSDDGSTVEVRASIDLPNKFHNFLENEGERYELLGEQ